MSVNDELLAAIRRRGDGGKPDPFGYGILTADRHVKNLERVIGMDRCYRFLAKGKTSYDDLLKQSRQTPVYSNEDMVPVADASSLSGLDLP